MMYTECSTYLLLCVCVCAVEPPSTPDGGLVSGMSSALSLEGWSWEEMSMESAAALNVNWPNPNPRRFRGFPGFGGPQEPPPSYEEQVQNLKGFFGEARAYRDAVAAGEGIRLKISFE